MSNFVKLDTGMLNSSIWLERDLRSVFVTALLMAEPYHLKQPAPQIAVRSLDETGWIIPAGWYGKVEAAGTGILMRDGIANRDAGMTLLEQLCAPDPESRSGSFDGRRMARIDGGYLVLNYFEYRERDYRRADPRGQADSYVYYAQDGDVVKIGLSKNPWARIKDLKVSRPHITIVATERGGSDLESMRHDQFKGDCIGGEWFRLRAIQTHIDGLSSSYVETTVVPTVATVATTKRHRHRDITTTAKDDRTAVVLGRYKDLHPDSRLSPKSADKIVRRIPSQYSADELIEALEGNAGDPWHVQQGKHELSYVLRNEEKIDQFREIRRRQLRPKLVGIGGDLTANELEQMGIRL